MNKEFAYLIGNFAADGSFYLSGKTPRFEFVDGSPYKEELKYSLKHICKIRNILENFLNKKLPQIVKRENKYVLKFRNSELSNIFYQKFKFSCGKKYNTIDIPLVYKDTKYEKYFWIGYLDGDGSIARTSRKLSVESMSKNIINSFSNYLTKENILFSKYESKRLKENSHVIVIRSVSFRDFAKKIGFNHPLKFKLLNEKLKGKDFHITNKVLYKVNKSLLDYTNFFDDSVFVENGRDVLIRYGYIKYSRQNIRFNELLRFLTEKNLSKEEILQELSGLRFKKSKGSINSIKLPMYFNNDLFRISKYVRIRNGGIIFSKRYIESFNEDFIEIVRLTEEMFGLSPKFTCKNEPLFCSGVLSDFFNNLINKESN